MNRTSVSSAAPPRLVLVLPSFAIGEVFGGGQRSRVLFDAMRRIGPVEVIVLHTKRTDPTDEAYPEAASFTDIVELLPSPSRPRTKWHLYARRVVRHVRLGREYAPVPRFGQEILARLDDRPTVLVYRYFQTFALAGIDSREAPYPVQIVDLDDRDDQKLASAADAMISNRIVRAAFRNYVGPRVRAILRSCLTRASHLWFVAPEDVESFAEKPHSIIPNVPFSVPDRTKLSRPSERSDVLMVAASGWRPNEDGAVWFLEKVWPRILDARPETRFRIVGRGGWPSIKERFPDLPNVDVIGEVDDLAAEYDAARIVVSPIFEGGGSKIKVVEACAYGRPIVAVNHSLRGFGADIQAAIPHSDEPDGFASLCLDLLTDDAAVDTLATRLRDLQQTQFSRAAVEERIRDSILSALAASDRAGEGS